MKPATVSCGDDNREVSNQVTREALATPEASKHNAQ